MLYKIFSVAESAQNPRILCSPLISLQRGNSSTGRKLFSRGTSLIRDIMSAILLTAGPVTSNVSFSRRGPMSLRSISKEQFQTAANMLQAAHLGTAIFVMQSTRGSVVFVKKPPDEAREAIEANCDIIMMDKYAARYYQQIPTCITVKIREHLISKGLLTLEQANMGINVPSFLPAS